MKLEVYKITENRFDVNINDKNVAQIQYDHYDGEVEIAFYISARINYISSGMAIIKFFSKRKLNSIELWMRAYMDKDAMKKNLYDEVFILKIKKGAVCFSQN